MAFTEAPVELSCSGWAWDLFPAFASLSVSGVVSVSASFSWPSFSWSLSSSGSGVGVGVVASSAVFRAADHAATWSAG